MISAEYQRVVPSRCRLARSTSVRAQGISLSDFVVRARSITSNSQRRASREWMCPAGVDSERRHGAARGAVPGARASGFGRVVRLTASLLRAGGKVPRLVHTQEAPCSIQGPATRSAEHEKSTTSDAGNCVGESPDAAHRPGSDPHQRASWLSRGVDPTFCPWAWRKPAQTLAADSHRPRNNTSFAGCRSAGKRRERGAGPNTSLRWFVTMPLLSPCRASFGESCVVPGNDAGLFRRGAPMLASEGAHTRGSSPRLTANQTESRSGGTLTRWNHSRPLAACALVAMGDSRERPAQTRARKDSTRRGTEELISAGGARSAMTKRATCSCERKRARCGRLNGLSRRHERFTGIVLAQSLVMVEAPRRQASPNLTATDSGERSARASGGFDAGYALRARRFQVRGEDPGSTPGVSTTQMLFADRVFAQAM